MYEASKMSCLNSCGDTLW